MTNQSNKGKTHKKSARRFPARKSVTKTAKKMNGPMKFEKNTSKRNTPKKRNEKPERRMGKKDTILRSIRDNIKKSPAKKVAKKRAILPSTLQPGMERLERYMAHVGIASRREAKEFINKGLVTVNGKVVREPGHGIKPDVDKVKIAGGVLENKETILFYKPRGIETVKTSPDAIDIHDKFPQFKHLAPIGRLDKDSEGLILLSNDGVLARTVTGENSTIDKEYRVTVREDVIPAVLQKMEHGMKIEKIITKPCVAKKVAQNEFAIVLHEGHKHQVRRMANACKLTVTRLVRVRIGELTIGKMTAGNFKKIPNDLIQEMKK